MSSSRIDVVMRLWAESPNRRSVVPLLVAVILAAISGPLPMRAKTRGWVRSDGNGKPIHGGGGSGGGGKKGGSHSGGKKDGKKKDKKKHNEKKGVQSQCNADAQECVTGHHSYCYYRYYLSGETYIHLCRDAFNSCCVQYATCTERAYDAANACIAATKQLW
jgi:hypothetical protein